MTFDYYAYWNGEATAAIFQMIAGLTASGDFLSLAKSMTLFGLLSTVAAAAIRIEGRMILSWFAATVLFFFVALIPKCDVTVLDVRAMSAKTISGVPISIGLIAGTSSSVGRWLGEAFETAMTDVDAAKFSQFGAVFPERVVAAIEKTGPVLPKTRLLLNDFVTQCVAPEILDSDAKRAELMASTSLWDTVKSSGWVNPARFVLVEGEPLYCDAAIAEIEAVIRNEEIPAQEKLLMTRLTNADDGLTETALRKAIPEARALLLGTSESMEKSLEHAMLLTAFPEGISRAAERAGSPLAAGAAFAKAQGNLASEISFRAMGEIASAFLPKLRTALEFITLAAFPIVIVMAAAMGTAAGAVIRMYVTIFVWLMLWAPLAAVINYLLIHIDASPMSRLMEAYGGVTLESATLVRELGASSQAMAGYLMLLMPVVAFMIARASEMSATSFASAIMSPAGSAAGAASSAAAMGNISAGNASIANVSAGNTGINKTDLGSSFVSGDVAATTTPFGTVTRNAATGQVTGMSAASWNLGVTATTSSSAVASAVQSSSSDASSAVGQSAVRTTGVESSVSQAASHASSMSAGTETKIASTSSTSTAKGISRTNGYGYAETARLGREGRTMESLDFGMGGVLRFEAGRRGEVDIDQTLTRAASAGSGHSVMGPDELGGDAALTPPPISATAAASSSFANGPARSGTALLSGAQASSAPLGLSAGGQVQTRMQSAVVGSITDTGSSMIDSARRATSDQTTNFTRSAQTFNSETASTDQGESISVAHRADGTQRDSIRKDELLANTRSETDRRMSSSVRHGGVAISGDISQAIGTQAMTGFNSPEEFLAHYNNPAVRAALIRGINLSDIDSEPLTQNLVPKAAPHALTTKPESIFESQISEISNDAAGQRAKLTEQMPAAPSAPTSPASFGSIESGLRQASQQEAARHRAAALAGEEYARSTTSASQILDNAFLGAQFYESPRDRFEENQTQTEGNTLSNVRTSLDGKNADIK